MKISPHSCLKNPAIRRNTLYKLRFLKDEREQSVAHGSKERATFRTHGWPPAASSLSPVQVAHTYCRPVPTTAGAQWQLQQARCACPLCGARQRGFPALEEQQLGGSAQRPRHRQGLVPRQCLEERDSFVAPSPCHLERHHEEVAPVPVKQLVVSAALILLSLDGLAFLAALCSTQTGQC